MQDKIQSATKKAAEEVAEVREELSELIEELPEELEEIRRVADKTLGNISDKLSGFLKDNEVMSDEARLQAHLGLMEAREKLEASQAVIDDLAQKGTDRSKTLMDELEVKAHLAKMEAEDFWEKRGPELTEEFNKSKDEMAAVAARAADELQEQFGKWNKLFKEARNKK